MNKYIFDSKNPDLQYAGLTNSQLKKLIPEDIFILDEENFPNIFSVETDRKLEDEFVFWNVYPEEIDIEGDFFKICPFCNTVLYFGEHQETKMCVCQQMIFRY